MSSSNIKEILKIKENFPSLLSKKIKEVYRTINEPKKEKPKLNMTTKGPLKRQVIVYMSSTNTSKFIVLSRQYIANINRALIGIKSDIMANFIKADQWGLIITIDIILSQLPQSKSYLKILDILYFIEGTNIPIISSIVENIIKITHIFNDIYLVSKLHIIKALPKSNIAVIWIDIWDT